MTTFRLRAWSKRGGHSTGLTSRDEFYGTVRVVVRNGTIADEASQVHDGNAVCNAEDVIEVVRNYEHGNAS